MSMPGVSIFVFVLLVVLLALLVVQRMLKQREIQAEHERRSAEDAAREVAKTNSILHPRLVENALREGAPPTPWALGEDDFKVMTAIEAYFVRAIPNPNDDGRGCIRETMGNGGPQLELYVPVLSSMSPVAVLAANWNSLDRAVESNLFFFGNVPERLARAVSNNGFELGDQPQKDNLTVFRKRRSVSRLRSA